LTTFRSVDYLQGVLQIIHNRVILDVPNTAFESLVGNFRVFEVWIGDTSDLKRPKTIQVPATEIPAKSVLNI
jgi:hypothetical protein